MYGTAVCVLHYIGGTRVRGWNSCIRAALYKRDQGDGTAVYVLHYISSTTSPAAPPPHPGPAYIMQHVYSCSTPSLWSRLYNAARILLFHHPHHPGPAYIMQHVYSCSISTSPWSRLYNAPSWSRLYNAARIQLFHHPITLVPPI